MKHGAPTRVGPKLKVALAGVCGLLAMASAVTLSLAPGAGAVSPELAAPAGPSSTVVPGSTVSTGVTSPAPALPPLATATTTGPQALPACTSPVTSVSFDVDGSTVANLRHHVNPGSRVTAKFAVPAGCVARLRLSAFYEAAPRFGDPNTNQTLAQRATGSFGPGTGELGPVQAPGCNFQLDFVQVIGGVATTISAANSGTSSCAGPQASMTGSCPQPSAAAVHTPGASETLRLSNTGPGSDTFEVARSDSGRTDIVTVAAGGSALRSYAVADGTQVLFTVVDDQTPQFHGSFQAAATCTPPLVSASFACIDATPTASIQATSPYPVGALEEDVTVTEGQATATVIHVPGGGSAIGKVTYPTGQQIVLVATGPGGLRRSFTSPAIGSCAEASTTTTAPSTTIPSGASTTLPGNTSTTVPSGQVVPPLTSSGSSPQGGNPATLGVSAATDPSAATVAAPSHASGLLAFTGFNVRAFLSWALVLFGGGAVCLLFAAAFDPATTERR